MRKYFYFILIIVLLIPVYFLFAASNPKTVGRFPFMIFLLAIDIYLWISLWKKINPLPVSVKSLSWNTLLAASCHFYFPDDHFIHK